MHLVLLELTKQIVDLLGLRNEIRGTDQRLPTEGIGFGEMRQQVLDIQDATDVVDRILIDGNAGVVVLNNALDDFMEFAFEIEVNDILTTGHHLLGRLIAKADNTFQHILLLFQVLLIGEFKSLFQIVNTQHMILRLHDLACQSP